MTTSPEPEPPLSDRPGIAELTQDGLRAHYEGRAAELKQALTVLDARGDALSRQRGVVMIGIIAGTLVKLIAGLPAWGWLIPGAFVVVFMVLVVRHAFVASERTLIDERNNFVLAGQRRMNGEPEPADAYRPKVKDPDGSRFSKPEHPNAADLDLFGPSSLFVSVSRAETAVGEETLAKWLLDPSAPVVVRERQSAARELLQKPRLLEDLSVFAKRAESRGRAEEPLALWGEAPAELPIGEATTPELRKRGLLVLAARVLVPITVTAFLVWSYVDLPFQRAWLLWLAPFVAQVMVFASLYGPIARMVNFVSSREAPFGRFRAVFERIEGAELESPSLAGIVSVVRGKEGASPASQEIAKLERIVGFADVRHNTIIHVLLNLGFLYDVWVALALERWRKRVGRQTRAWLVALGELEAIASIATYAGEHPEFTWPTLKEGPAHLDAKELGHPLIGRSARVCNDTSLPGPGRAFLVTGSNMSGKSTFLRAMGLCSVMAGAGMPVCAKRAELSPLRPWTSIRIADALERGWSHFYAELMRLKTIVAASHAEGLPVLFLLDEILHGTNSRERTIGARGVVLDLVRRGAIGGVSTHDFALVAIADESEGRVRTVHFSDHVEDGKMIFDFKLKEGVVQSTNAIRLMKAVGIDVDYGVEDPTPAKPEA